MREMHGLSHVNGKRTKLHMAWLNMRNRCNNPRGQDYAYYGGRGITVCRRWDRFVNFVADMGKPPTPQHTIERRNGNRGYTPGNCYWATRKEQSVNRDYCRIRPGDRTSIKNLYRLGYTQAHIAEQFGVTQSYISQIVRTP